MDHSKHHHHAGHEHTHDEHHDHDHAHGDHHDHHDHSHGAGDATPAQGHSHGEPTGNAIEKIGFTRSQFLRMCLAGVAAGAVVPSSGASRSEEHTSELQSRLHLVCRLLLEKKKNDIIVTVECRTHEKPA